MREKIRGGLSRGFGERLGVQECALTPGLRMEEGDPFGGCGDGIAGLPCPAREM